MALSRPPTALTLTPSDVEDLRDFITQRNLNTVNGDAKTSSDGRAQANVQQGSGRQVNGAVEGDVVQRERLDREEREARGQRRRVMGTGH
ncbi:hypothetical protein JCM11641_005715 [Rhodosporidiobolus odoratus]